MEASSLLQFCPYFPLQRIFFYHGAFTLRSLRINSASRGPPHVVEHTFKSWVKSVKIPSICAKGGSASMRIMYTHITSSSDISYDNRITRLSYNKRAVPDGRSQHYLFQPVFMQMTYPSRYVCFGRSRVHTTVETTCYCM